MSTRFILVRHGETPASKIHHFAGSTDVPLTDHGQQQARELAKRLRSVRIDAFHCSPMLRCRMTAEPIIEATGRKPTLVDDIRECDFGSWEGLDSRKARERDPEVFERWVSDDAHPPPDGESWAEMGARVGRWFEEAAERYEGRTVLAVCHGGPILWLARHVTQAPYLAMLAFEIDPCSITLIQRRRRLWRLRGVNDVSHLRDVLGDVPPAEPLPPTQPT